MSGDVPSVVCVTGMHRSGTSLASRVLNVLGVSLGDPTALMPANDFNLRGFWEHLGISELNEEIIVHFGGRWHRPPALPDGWETDRALDEFRRRAITMLRRDLLSDDAELIGWKDPRNSLLLPFWRTVTPIDRTILVVRDPDEVAASLLRREGHASEHAAYLWLRYVLAAWRNDPQHILVHNDVMLRDVTGTARRLASELGLPEPAPDVLERLTAEVDPTLQTAGDYAAPAGPMIELARSVHTLTREIASNDVLSLAHAMHDTWVRDERTRGQIDDLTRDVRRRRADANELDSQIRELEARLQVMRRTEREGRHALHEATSSFERVRVELREAELERDHVAGVLAASQAELERTQQEAEALTTTMRADLAKSRQALEAARRDVQKFKTQFEAANATTAATRKELDATRARMIQFETAFERLRKRRLVRVSLALAQVMRPVFRFVRRLRKGEPVRSPDGSAPITARITQSRDARRLVKSIQRQAPTPAPTARPRVTIVILNRDGEHHLRRCWPALEATRYDDLEVVVVDNGSTDGSIAYLESRTKLPLHLVRNPDNRSFSEGNNQGIAAATGDLILLLNNDVEPIVPTWLAAMVETLEAHDAAAVGARLIYPVRPGLDNAGDEQHPDLTLQHRGLHFDAADGVPRGRNLGAGEDPLSDDARAVHEVPAVTAACMLVRRDALDAVGWLTVGYRYGTEDVDLCMKLRARGDTIVYDGRAALWHHEFGTQNEEGRERKAANRRVNRELFLDRWGPQIFREVLLDRLWARQRWSFAPLHVAITVTHDDPSAGFGDWYTAHELGDALAGFGWKISYIEKYKGHWYQLDPTIDVIVSLLDLFDVSKIPPNVITIAWIRNWTERWLEREWFDEHDLVLVSSTKSKDIVESRSAKRAHLFPLATNPERFSRQTPDPALQSDVMFAGNHWGRARPVATALAALPPSIDVKVFGAGWEHVPHFRRIHAGRQPYERLPVAYSSTRIAIDGNAESTAPYAAVNSRVFDALATGTLVLSENVEGMRELFDEDFPVWTDAASMQTEIERLLADDALITTLAERYQTQVHERHTYAHRANELRDIIDGWARAPRVAICIGVPDKAEAQSWGDMHFARGLQASLEQLGLPSTVHIKPQWDHATTARSDVMLHLFGLSPKGLRGAQCNVMWNISHPELVTPEQVSEYHLAFVASTPFAAELAAATKVPVVALHQATDPRRFFPDPTGPRHELLFVANSRKVHRRIIDDLGATEHDLAVYGRDWTPDLIDPKFVRGQNVPNAELRGYYSNADIVLNDHWDDMRDKGFLSNRLYDALACGAFVLSDHVAGIDEEFDGCVVTYDDADDLRAKVDKYLGDADTRKQMGERGRAVVLERHTFAYRATAMVEQLSPLLDGRPRTVVPSRDATSTSQA